MIRYSSLTVHGCGSPILDEVDLELPERGVAVLLGPSGCGKTTLMRCTIREDEEDPDLVVRGSIEVDGREVRSSRVPTTELRRSVGLIAQRPTPFPGTAFQNVLFALRLTTKLSRAEARARALAALEEAGLEESHYGTPAECLSGGQLKRLAVARAIALQPRVLLMDEPSNGLDPLSAARLERLIELLGQSRLVVVVTHDVALARRVAGEVFVLWPFEAGSRVVERGPARDVLFNPREPETRLFVEAADIGAAALIPYAGRLRDEPAQECQLRTLELDHQ